MSKLAVIIVGGVIVVGGAIGGFVALNKKDDPKTNTSQTGTADTGSSKEVQLDDPDGVYKLFSDASIISKPEDNVRFGNGQTLTWEYDGSKSENDEYATLSYQLFYIQDDGKVQPMGGGNVQGSGGKGTYTLSDSVFNSSAKDRKGFLELTVTWGTSFNGESYSSNEEKLGMYSVEFDVAE